jgi:hypothetical protein
MLRKTALVFTVLIALSAIPTLGGCGGVVAGSGESQTFEMNYTEFTRLEIGGGFNMEISRSDSYYVSITIDKALYEYLNIAKRGDVLHIGLKSNYTYAAVSRGGIIQLPDLRRLEATGGARVKITGFSMNHNLDIQLSGGGQAELAAIQAGDTYFKLSEGTGVRGDIMMNNASIDASSGSTVNLTGSAANIKIKAGGGSTVTADEITVKTANVDLSGGSKAAITVSDLLEVHLSGGSTLTYAGNPKIGAMDISGDAKFIQVKP